MTTRHSNIRVTLAKFFTALWQVAFIILLTIGGGGCGGGTRGSGGSNDFEVKGVLVNAQTGAPIAGVQITDPTGVHSTLTNAKGEFVLLLDFEGERLELRVEGQGIDTSTFITGIPQESKSIRVRLTFSPEEDSVDGTLIEPSPPDTDKAGTKPDRENESGTTAPDAIWPSPTLAPIPAATPAPTAQPTSRPTRPESAPELTVEPIPTLTSSARLTVRGTKSAGSALTINGNVKSVSEADTVWQVSVTLREGRQALRFVAIEAGGSESAVIERSIRLDTSAPAQPAVDAAPALVNQADLTLSGTKEAGSGIMLGTEELVAPDSRTQWSAQVHLPHEGENAIELQSHDRAGNLSSALVLNITRDSIAPELLTAALVNVAHQEITLELTFSEEALPTLTVDGSNSAQPVIEAVAGAPERRRVTIRELAPATPYTAQIALRDAAGNQSGEEPLEFNTLAATYMTETLRFDYSGAGGNNSATIVGLDVVDMGPGAAGIRVGADGVMELYSRHLLYTRSAAELTAVFHTTFETVDTSEITTQTNYLFSEPQGGFFELWYEDGSGRPADTQNIDGFNDAVLVASGAVVGLGDGYYSGDTSSGAGSAASIIIQILAHNQKYLLDTPELVEISLSLSNSGQLGPEAGVIPRFALLPNGNAPQPVDGLLALSTFPDGGLVFRRSAGDVTYDGRITANDIDQLYANLGHNELRYDLNRDGSVDRIDVDYLVKTILKTAYGDANLDRTVSTSDQTSLQANYGRAGGWAQGDFNGDGQVNISDMATLSANWNFGT